MPIQVEVTVIPDVKTIRANRFHDDRGFFTESYKESEYLELGIPRFVQDNLSKSAKGVIRGLHWQESPYGQGKLVKCISGSILDVAVDVRKGSSTYGKHVSVEVGSNEQIALRVPEGFAHGFQALEDDTRVHYKVTNYWNKASERSLLWSDPKIGIEWKALNPIISEKDNLASKFDDLLTP